MTSRLRGGIADLQPGYAAFVMATGIVSTGLFLFGWRVLSVALLVVAALGFVVLLVAYLWRTIAYPQRLLADARDPAQGFGYFTLVAAPNVLGMRFALDHHILTAAVLGLVSVPAWLVLTYAIPGALIVGHRSGPVLPRTNGSWFLWVVGTQSLAAAAAAVATGDLGLLGWLAPLAVAFWGIGVVLYLMLVGLVTVSLLDDATTPHALSPTYWVYMGATAITVLAAAKILELPTTLPVMMSTHQVVSGIAFLLWAFGSWWIPLLLVFAVWRHLARGTSGGYQPTLWSMVFPLGMYAAASANYGQTTGLAFMVAIARVEVWVGFAAWVVVAIAMARSWLVPRRPGSSTRPPTITAGVSASDDHRRHRAGPDSSVSPMVALTGASIRTPRSTIGRAFPTARPEPTDTATPEEGEGWTAIAS